MRSQNCLPAQTSFFFPDGNLGQRTGPTLPGPRIPSSPPTSPATFEPLESSFFQQEMYTLSLSGILGDLLRAIHQVRSVNTRNPAWGGSVFLNTTHKSVALPACSSD